MIARTKNFILPCAALAFFTACGLGGDDEGNPRHHDNIQNMMAMNDRIDLLDRDTTMPTSGTADFAGYAHLWLDARGESQSLVGEMAASVDFAQESFSGRIFNVAVEDGPNLGGQLDINSPRVGNRFPGGRATGTLTDGDDRFAFDLGLNGLFLGDAAGQPAGLSAAINGTALVDGASTNVGGFAVAERRN